ncbi:hypothetical protein HK101_005785, partial [Irineochytrium annulatum]
MVSWAFNGLLDRVLARSYLRGILALVLVLFLTGVTFALAVPFARGYGTLMALLPMAWAFGLRHGFDADHVVAIDNVTRKLLTDTPHSHPYLVGLFFSLGHSSVVIIASLVVALTASSIDNHLGDAGSAVLGWVGTTVSIVFLIVLAGWNAVICWRIWKGLKEEAISEREREIVERVTGEAVEAFVDVGRGSQEIKARDDEVQPAEDPAFKDGFPFKVSVSVKDDAAQKDAVPSPTKSDRIIPHHTHHHLTYGGLMTRLFSRVFGYVDKPWKMLPVGFLFGLGFDTATEIALLSITAIQASEGMPPGLIMFLSALFTLGMALSDTADSILMASLYQWALLTPLRKLYYNLIITMASVSLAVVVAALSILSAYQSSSPDATGPFWDAVGA